MIYTKYSHPLSLLFYCTLLVSIHLNLSYFLFYLCCFLILLYLLCKNRFVSGSTTINTKQCWVHVFNSFAWKPRGLTIIFRNQTYINFFRIKTHFWLLHAGLNWIISKNKKKPYVLVELRTSISTVSEILVLFSYFLVMKNRVKVMVSTKH